MSYQPIPDSGTGSTPANRACARPAVVLARLLTRLPPRRLQRLLGLISRGARPAAYEQALSARNAVTAVSALCAGREGCLPRSVATALVCRARGIWPAWCVGVRAAPPFAAHAWVETTGRPVGESIPDNYLRVLITVPPQPAREGTDGQLQR
ncbi:lasso peptide biosynthesis B2 protein [Streptomyces sioyaensis]|uniref:lasso peptide biosynthesis B2 protein n=1 Tax=Streptomyces sioyaensis TaxID=67364 RepID=UPI003648221B